MRLKNKPERSKEFQYLMQPSQRPAAKERRWSKAFNFIAPHADTVVGNGVPSPSSQYDREHYKERCMAGDEFSIAAISSRKLQDTADKFQVAVLKKAIDSQGDVAKQLIEASAATSLPDGIGKKLNTVA